MNFSNVGYIITIEHISNVVVVHCIAGKGRTGTLIASYLMYSQAFTDYNKAIQFCAIQRGAGPTHPGQVRYIKYLSDSLHRNVPIFKPTVKRLLGIHFIGIPNYSNGSCRPSIEVINIRTEQVVVLSC